MSDASSAVGAAGNASMMTVTTSLTSDSQFGAVSLLAFANSVIEVVVTAVGTKVIVPLAASTV